MKINTQDYRVGEGDDVDLYKWPMQGKPVCKSKEDYKALPKQTGHALCCLKRARDRYQIEIVLT